MGQTLDMLLAIDPAKLKDRPTKRLYMPRFSELAGGDIYFTIRALTLDEIKAVREKATHVTFNKKSHEREEVYDSEDGALFIILEGVIDPDLRDKRLLERYEAATPKELLKKILLSGEIDSLSSQIGQLSGFKSGATDADMVEELKN